MYVLNDCGQQYRPAKGRLVGNLKFSYFYFRLFCFVTVILASGLCILGIIGANVRLIVFSKGPYLAARGIHV